MTSSVRHSKRMSQGLQEVDWGKELQWRSWFPRDVQLDDRLVIPDDEVEVLVEAFRRFCLEAVKIKVPGARIPLELRDAQLDTVRSWIKYRNTIALKARQIGFSTLAAAFMLWCALGGSDRQIYALSKKKDASVSLVSKVRYAYRSMPEWARKRGPKLLNKTLLAMQFDNDSFIQSSPTGSDPIRGETAFLVIVDEWASFENAEEAWASIQPVADIGGRVCGISTAKGEGSFFHRLWLGAEARDNSFYPIFHPWWAVPERDQEWYDRQVRDLEPWQLYQEYPSNPEEAFVGSGNPFFNLEVVRANRPREAKWKGFVRYDPEASEVRYQRDQDDAGPLWVYEEPSPRKAYVVGADIAQGLEHGDWSVAYVMEAESGEIVAVYRAKPEPDEFAHILYGLGYMYGYALLAPEVNNHGRSTVDHLKRLKYGRIYRRRSKLKRGGDAPTETIGWLTTHGNKHDICLELGVWLREHNVPHEATIQELKTFRAEQRGDRVRLQGSPHDDCVMALAITVEARKYAILNNLGTVKPKDVPNSIDWWAKKLEKAKKGSRRIRPSL